VRTVGTGSGAKRNGDLLVLEQEQAAVPGCRGGGGGGGRRMLTWAWSADPNLAGGRERRGEAGGGRKP